MASFSVIVTAHNLAPVLPLALRSAEQAIACYHRHLPSGASDAEIVVVDDGSTDNAWSVLQQISQAKPSYRLIRRDRPSSPSCARNTGAAAARGDLLFFLDGDDRFLPEHILACQEVLQDPHVQFVKTGVRLADPVHPDWRRRIVGSLVINLCVRRWCHFHVGGFPDDHLFVRQGDLYSHRVDLFYKYEDQYYNQLIAVCFAGVEVAAETVEYGPLPGNSFDRQYAKLCQPYGAVASPLVPEVAFRLDLCQRIIDERIRVLKSQRSSEEVPLSHAR